jgi:hypothetical protein
MLTPQLNFSSNKLNNDFSSNKITKILPKKLENLKKTVSRKNIFKIYDPLKFNFY